MTQTSKLDLTTADQRGLTIGLNEFSGYFGVAVAGIVTGYLATAYGPREGLMIFGLTVVALAGLLTLLWVKDTLPWAHAEGKKHAAGLMTGPKPRYPTNISDKPGTWEVFTLMSWRDARLASVSQAGLVEVRRRWCGCSSPFICPSTASRLPASAGWSASTASSGACRSSLPATCPTASAARNPSSGACGCAAPASRWCCWARASCGGRSPPR
jgi:MFS family permease